MAAQELASTPLFSDANLVHYWKLENTSATIGGLTLTNGASNSFVSAKFNNGDNNGNDQTDAGGRHLDVANDLGIHGGACTFSFWLKLNAELVGGQNTFFSQADAGTNTSFLVRYNYNSGDIKLQTVRRKNGGSDDQISVSETLGTSTYHHIVLTYDGSTLISYLDGVAIGSTSASGSGSSGAVDFFYIGSSAVPDDNTPGIFDDFAVFSRALTANEVSSLYNGFATGTGFFAIL